MRRRRTSRPPTRISTKLSRCLREAVYLLTRLLPRYVVPHILTRWQGFDGASLPTHAIGGLKYMLLCKIMLNECVTFACCWREEGCVFCSFSVVCLCACGCVCVCVCLCVRVCVCVCVCCVCVCVCVCVKAMDPLR
jgi:hypothetical protein